MSAKSTALNEQIKQSVALLGGIFDWDVARARLDELEPPREDPALWNDPRPRRR